MRSKTVTSLVAFGSVSMLIFFMIGCVPPASPTNLAKKETLPCTITWTDNSANEQGFNIYVGGSCAGCQTNTEWQKVGSVGANVTTYSWEESCCDVSECSCAMVKAFNQSGESKTSNIIILAPVC
jgi:hypothetical protein